MSPTDINPISIAGPGQTICTSRGPQDSTDPYQCTREQGHDLPHEAAGQHGTVFARWVDWTNDAFDNGLPVVVPAVSRPARIAALHMAGLFLAEHTDLPMAAYVTMEVHDLTETQLRAISDLHGVPVQHGSTSTWVEIIVGLETLHGISIRYMAFGKRAN